MFASFNALKLLGASGIIAFSVFVAHSVFVGNSISSALTGGTLASSQVAAVVATTVPDTYLQVLVVAGEDPASVVTNPPFSGGYPYWIADHNWIADHTLKPPLASQTSFSVTNETGGGIRASGITEGIMVNQATTSGRIIVSVPRLEGYEVSGYIVRIAPQPPGLDTDRVFAYSLFVDGGIGANYQRQGATLATVGGRLVVTHDYFSFTLFPNNALTRLVVFYKKLPVACRNITFELLEEKIDDDIRNTRFSLASTPTTTARDLSHLVTAFIPGSDVVPDYRIRATSVSSATLGIFDVSSSRFGIVDYESPDPENEGILESDVGLLRVVTPFNANIRNMVVQSNWSLTTTPFYGTHATISVGPFPATCPAVCQLEFQSLDSGTESEGCCAGLAPVEGENGFVCKKI